MGNHSGPRKGKYMGKHSAPQKCGYEITLMAQSIVAWFYRVFLR